MAKVTITEALAEIKTINKRLQNKREFVLQYLCQHESLIDPLISTGVGAVDALKRERQAIDDLEQRIVDIRSAVAKVNDTTLLTVNSKTRSVTEWLAWRKDVAKPSRDNAGTGAFLAAMRQRIATTRLQLQAQQQPRFAAASATATVGGEQKPPNIRVFVNEQDLAKESEQFEETLGQLDGKLSLIAATTFIDLK